jgi:hypothetical protein
MGMRFIIIMLLFAVIGVAPLAFLLAYALLPVP